MICAPIEKGFLYHDCHQAPECLHDWTFAAVEPVYSSEGDREEEEAKEEDGEGVEEVGFEKGVTPKKKEDTVHQKKHM